jgi:hypothetical protein
MTQDGLVRAIFIDAQTRLRKPTNLKALTTSIDQLDWFSAREEGVGNLYEGLLEKNAAEKKMKSVPSSMVWSSIGPPASIARRLCVSGAGR